MKDLEQEDKVNNMELLIDYFRLEPVQIVSESKESGTMKIRGIFGRAEEFNKVADKLNAEMRQVVENV